MSRLTDLPETALHFVIGVLLPLILPRNGGDAAAAKASQRWRNRPNQTSPPKSRKRQ